MSDLEELLAKAKAETGETKFTPDAARLAGIKSGAARRPIDKEKDARRAYAYVCQTMDTIGTRLQSPKQCPHCKRGGPIDIRALESLARMLKDFTDTVIWYAWGKPAQESRLKRDGSVEDYKRAYQEVLTGDHAKHIPEGYDSALSESDPPEVPEPTED